MKKWILAAGLMTALALYVVVPDTKVTWPKWRREVEKILAETRK